MSKKSKKKILLISDTAADCYILHDAPRNFIDKTDTDWQQHRQWRSWMLPGGVHLLTKFMRMLDLEVREFGPAERSPQLGSLARLRFVKAKGKDNRLRYADADSGKERLECRVESYDGYQELEEADQSQGFLVGNNRAFNLNSKVRSGLKPDVVILNDAGGRLRTMKDLITGGLNQVGNGIPLILKMHRPLAEGRIFAAVSKMNDANRTIFVHVDDLRDSGVRINRCLSWDAVVDDVKAELGDESGLLRKLLLKNARLLVLFGAEAVLSIRADSQGAPLGMELTFIPTLLEGDIDRKHDGNIVGKMSVFLSYLSATLGSGEGGDGSASDVEVSMKGVAHFAAQPMMMKVQKNHLPELDYPELPRPKDKRLSGLHCITLNTGHILDKTDLLAAAARPNPIAATGGEDSGFERLARDVVKRGQSVLVKVPSARFGKLLTVDHGEIEAYRAIDRLIESYLASDATKPMSIAAFGPPGSGKSFGVKQLVDKDRSPIREFNLSQVEPSDLRGFFHEIRDDNLAGKTPLCFFDEFDSQGMKLLAHFLAPMQDGKFRDGSRVHPTGRGIFVFAGGTAWNYARFVSGSSIADDGESQTQGTASRKPGLSELKVPDFVSRLSGHIDVKGIDKTRDDDDAFVLRRAILLRSFIEERLAAIIGPESPETGDAEAEIDEGVIRAFLQCEKYEHGARSMEQIIRMCGMGSNPRQFTISDLPKAEQLAMHVNARDFLEKAVN